MDTTIRAAVEGDEKNLTRLNALVQELHLVNRPDNFKPTVSSEVEKWFVNMMRNPSARIWIAEEGETVIGFAVAITHTRDETPFCRARRWCEIEQIVVEPKFRRKGVSKKLVNQAAAEAAREGVTEVELTTWAFNEEAQSTFHKLGFVPRIIRFERKR